MGNRSARYGGLHCLPHQRRMRM